MNFVPLVFQVIYDVIAYLTFLILWILVFALFYQVLGVGYEEDFSRISYFSHAWLMSTKGDKGDLSSDYWKTDDKSIKL